MDMHETLFILRGTRNTVFKNTFKQPHDITLTIIQNVSFAI